MVDNKTPDSKSDDEIQKLIIEFGFSESDIDTCLKYYHWANKIPILKAMIQHGPGICKSNGNSKDYCNTCDAKKIPCLACKTKKRYIYLVVDTVWNVKLI